MAKYHTIAKLLEKRIRYGDYLLKDIPSERELAFENGVSYMTARRAILEVVEKGLLVRQPNKRLVVAANKSGEHKLKVALLVPSLPSAYIAQWHSWLDEMGTKRNFFVRLVSYSHWDDTIVLDTISGFDVVFLMPFAEDCPESLIVQIKKSGTPVVFLGPDMSQYEIPSLRLTSPEMVQGLLEHFKSLGHLNIDCLNTQPMSQVIRQRIEQWQLWMAAYGANGNLINEPTEPYVSSSLKAYRVVSSMLRENSKHTKALFCVSAEIAIAAMRAIHDFGLKVGEDILVCTADDAAGLAQILIPSLTCLADRSSKPYLSVCLDWILGGGKNWIGPYLVQPVMPSVFIGESTCPGVKGNLETYN